MLLHMRLCMAPNGAHSQVATAMTPVHTTVYAFRREAREPQEVRLASLRAMKEPAHLAVHPVLFETASSVFYITERHAGLLRDDVDTRARDRKEDGGLPECRLARWRLQLRRSVDGVGCCSG